MAISKLTVGKNSNQFRKNALAQSPLTFEMLNEGKRRKQQQKIKIKKFVFQALIVIPVLILERAPMHPIFILRFIHFSLLKFTEQRHN